MQTPNVALVRARLEAGLEAHHAGRLHEAAAEYRQALALAPGDPDAAHLLGVALLGLGTPEEAIGHLERAARKYRNKAEVLANLGHGYVALRRYGDAERAFRKASANDPKNAQLQLGIAAALGFQSKFSEAEALLRRLSVRFPDLPLVWLNLGHVMLDQQRLDDALAAYRKAVEIDPRLVDAHNNIGRVFHARLQFSEAEENYRRAVELAPDYVPGVLNLASIAIDLGRFTEGEALARRAVQLAPHMTEGYSVLAAAIGFQGRILDATGCYARIAELRPDDDKAQAQYATTLLETGHANEGLRQVAHLARTGRLPDTSRQVFAAWLLAHGQLQDAWAEYLNRGPAVRMREKHADLRLTQSLPADCSGKRICVMREQGLGDELFFLRYAPRVAARGAALSYRAGRKLAASILRRVPCLARVSDEDTPAPDADFYVLVWDLPYALGESPRSALSGTIAVSRSGVRDYDQLIRLYWPTVPESLRIEPLPERLEALRAELAAFGPPPYIGITWRGGTAPENQQRAWLLHKEIKLPVLADHIRNVRGTMIALQRNPAPEEIEQLSQALGRPVHDLTALNDDLEGMHALLALLDDYVGVSNTNMHMRAAAGRTGRVIVPSPPEWRWMQFGRESPWFPGFRIYRQSLNGDWTRALDELKRDLEAAHGRECTAPRG